MSKRPTTTTGESSNSPKKKKSTSNQVHPFFKSTSSSSSTSKTTNQTNSKLTKKQQQIKSDELFSLNLLKSEGVNILTVKQAESKLTTTTTTSTASTSNSKLDSILIDSSSSDSEDEIIIIEDSPSPQASTSIATSKSKASFAPLFNPPKLPSTPPTPKKKLNSSISINSISSSSKNRITSESVPSGSTTSLTSTNREDFKPDIKPVINPSTNNSFFTSPSKPLLPTSTTSSSSNSQQLSKPLDTPLHHFYPSRDIKISTWPSNPKRAPYSFLVSAFVLISSTKSRLRIILILTNLFRSIIELDPESLEAVVYLVQGKLGPVYENCEEGEGGGAAGGNELGIGGNILKKAILDCTGVSKEKLRSLSNKLGDPGDVAYTSKLPLRLLLLPPPLILHSLFASLKTLPRMKGPKSQSLKLNLIKKLLISAQGEEVRYLVRGLVGNLRVGAVGVSVLVALGRAGCWSRNEGREGEEGEDEFWVTEEERERLREEDREVEERGGKKKKGGSKVTGGVGKGKGKGKGKAKIEEIDSDLDLEEEDLDIDELDEQSLLDSTDLLEDETSPSESTSEGNTTTTTKKFKSISEKLQAAEILIRKVFAQHPNYSHIVRALLATGLPSLPSKVPLQIGTPLQPMLGSITRSLSEVYTRLSVGGSEIPRPFVAEAKLDGQRCQLHVSIYGPPDAGGEGGGGGGGGGGGRWYEYSGLNKEGMKEGIKKRVWIRLFSRHLLDQTGKYPDLDGSIAALIERESSPSLTGREPLTSFIIDSEIIALDPKTGNFKSFQELSHRSKKGVEMDEIKVRVGVFGFDLMFLNGKSLLAEPFRKRRQLLRTIFKPFDVSPSPSSASTPSTSTPSISTPPNSDAFTTTPTETSIDPELLNPNKWAKWDLVPTCEDNDPEVLKRFFLDCLKMKCEGIMVKLLDHSPLPSSPLSPSSTSPTKPRKKSLPASYEPDKRADSWLKVKKDYLEDLGDSLDLVPVGAWFGMGRKREFWSPVLLACYDEETGTYSSVCKIMSGFTDEFYKSLSIRYPNPNVSTSSSTSTSTSTTSTTSSTTNATTNDDEEEANDGKELVSNSSKFKYPNVELGESMKCDIYFKPNEVWEIRCADLSLSPVYPAALGLISDERGISIRFPRFIKLREDKSAENATTSQQLADMFSNQGDKGGKVTSASTSMDQIEEVDDE